MGSLVLLLDLYSLVLAAASFLCWTESASMHPAARAVRFITEPVLGPVRKVVPLVRGWDLAPLLVFVLVRVLRALLHGLEP